MSGTGEGTMTPLTVMLGNHPHTRPLKDGTVSVDGVDCEYPESTPLPPAFARMVRELAYDICEMPRSSKMFWFRSLKTRLLMKREFGPVTSWLFPSA